jgi:hypothetical protein
VLLFFFFFGWMRSTAQHKEELLSR